MEKNSKEKLNELTENEFEKFCDISPVEKYLGIKINTKVSEYLSKQSYNEYKIKDKDGNEKDVFIKYITLVDYVKYLIGKYKDEDVYQLPEDEHNHEECKEKNFNYFIHDINNYAYVDSFFYYLSSITNDELKNFDHGIKCYDSFISLKNNCKINISDDIEYLYDSNYFNELMNDKKFTFEDENIVEYFMSDEKDKLDIKENVVLENLDKVDEDDDNIKENKCEIEEIQDFVLTYENLTETVTIKNRSSNSSVRSMSSGDSDLEDDTDDSDVDNSSDDEVCFDDEETNSDKSKDDDETDSNNSNDEEDDSEDEDYDLGDDDDDDSSSDSSIDDLNILLKKFPVQSVVIEKCHNTLDKLLETDEITIEELESALFQIIVTLHVYQKKFSFTHNDLHTNNVMYTTTDKEFLYYTYNNRIYKVPTFGKIYKIIDFGRAIYKFNNKLICSDSFSENGTAHTQYNFGPFLNPNKAIIEPNYSFDLTRLACSIFDFICDNVNDIQKTKKIPIYGLIIDWLMDDNGINVLYKKNGQERYPNFKLYKMITRLVHKHIPEEQIEKSVFDKYVVKNKDEISSEMVCDINF